MLHGIYDIYDSLPHPSVFFHGIENYAYIMVFLPFHFHDTEITAHIMEYTSGLLPVLKAQMDLNKYG